MKKKRFVFALFAAVLLIVCILAASAAAQKHFWAAADGGTEGQTLHESLSGEYYRALEEIPLYGGEDVIRVNGDRPFFTSEDRRPGEAYEYYSPLDKLGRCGVAAARLERALMPEQERESIGMIKPSGWHTVRYDGIVDRNYLYNRCHLIAYHLTGENANERNLITGTRYMNKELMLPIEKSVGDYLRDTGGQVLYRVTPLFRGGNLVADGVLIEAESLGDGGKAICLCRFLYNVQPGVRIDYATGDSALDGAGPAQDGASAPDAAYILNTGSMVFHRAECTVVKEMREKNKRPFTGTREQALAGGYRPCGVCRP